MKFLLEKLILVFLSEIKLTKNYLKKEVQLGTYLNIQCVKKSITKMKLFLSQKSDMIWKLYHQGKILQIFANYLLCYKLNVLIDFLEFMI